MALTIANFTLAAVTIGTTEHSITTNTAGPDSDTGDGMYQLFVAVPAAAVAADIFSIGIYETINGVQYEVDRHYFTGKGAAYGIVLPVLTLGVGWDMTLKKEAGTDRALSCHINKGV